MNKFLVIGVIAILALIGGYFLLGGGGAPQEASLAGNSALPAGGIVPAAPEDTAAPATVKEFVVDAGNFTFSVVEMKVKKGDTVRVVFRNLEGFHDWVVDEFAARTRQLKAGESQTIEFVAASTGTFEYYCSVGQHRQMGMTGKLIVE